MGAQGETTGELAELGGDNRSQAVARARELGILR
jgi:hypothetical protein